MIKKVWCKSFRLWWKKDNLLFSVQNISAKQSTTISASLQCAQFSPLHSCTQWSQWSHIRWTIYLTSPCFVLQAGARECRLQVKHWNIGAAPILAAVYCEPHLCTQMHSQYYPFWMSKYGGSDVIRSPAKYYTLWTGSGSGLLAKSLRSRGCQTPLLYIWLCPQEIG